MTEPAPHPVPQPAARPEPTPCSVPECNTDGNGEPCDRHETEQAHVVDYDVPEGETPECIDDCPGCKREQKHDDQVRANALRQAADAHDAHRTAVSGALGLGTGAPWGAITDRARQVTAELDAARVGDAPWIRAYREDLTAANKRAEQAEATIARVRDAVVQWRGWNPTENAWAIRDIERALSGDPDPRPQDPAALDGEQPDAGPERCFVCGAPAVINQVVDRRYLCGDCFLCRCGESPCVRTGVNDPAVSAEPEKPCFHPSWETEPTVGARQCTDCGEWLDPQPTPVELDGAALWAAIRDHAFNDTQWWQKVNWRRDHAQLNTYVQRGPGHTPTR